MAMWLHIHMSNIAWSHKKQKKNKKHCILDVVGNANSDKKLTEESIYHVLTQMQF